jgi:Flp pilus assembly pilin Flp
MLIAFSATKDIEYALISTMVFLAVIYAIKTPEERKKTGFI